MKPTTCKWVNSKLTGRGLVTHRARFYVMRVEHSLPACERGVTW